MKKLGLIAFICGIIGFSPAAMAIRTTTGHHGVWGYVGRDNASGGYGDFILAGSLGKSGMHGTFIDEWAVVGMVAREIVEHGGYFCPYQLQIINLTIITR